MGKNITILKDFNPTRNGEKVTPVPRHLPDCLWRTQYEGIIWISEMSDRHLLNAFALLTRRASDFQTEYETILRTGDEELIQTFYERYTYFKHSFNVMAAHVKARGLNGNPLEIEE